MAESENKETVDEVSLSEETQATGAQATPADATEQVAAAISGVGPEKPEEASEKPETELEKPSGASEKPQDATEEPEGSGKAPQANSEHDESEERPALPKRRDPTGDVIKNPILLQLTEAFPGIELKYINAVLIASQGVLDPAFNALLYLSDPSFEAEAAIPNIEPKATAAAPAQPPVSKTQLEQDELLARQLDAQYNKSRARNVARSMEDERHARERRIRKRQQEYERRMAQSGRPLSPEEQQYYAELEEQEEGENDFLSQLVDKDLPEFREKVGRQVQETGKRVNEWLSGFRKNWAQDPSQQSQYSQSPQQTAQRDFSTKSSSGSDYDTHGRPSHRTARFNSFGAKVGDDSVDSASRLASHGISLYNKDDDEINNDDDDDGDVAPQLPSRNKQKEVKPETTYIDTPENGTRKKWQPLPPEPINGTPSKVNATATKGRGNADADEEFLINTDDEL